MRRQLMKKMRKGSLTPSERAELKELDREVNRANRQAAGIGGAGLAAALAIASKTGALERGKDTLGEFLDQRAEAREDKKELKAKEKELEVLREAQGEYEDMLDKKAKLKERADARAEREKQVELKELRKAQGEYEKMVGKEKEKRKKDEKKLDERLEKRGGFDPRTGEYVDSAKQRAADEEFDREFDESLPDAEVMEAARLYNEERRQRAEELGAQVLTPEEQQMERFRNRTAVQDLRGDRSDLPLGDTDYTGGFETTGNRREFSSEDLFRTDGPRVNNAKGGYTPFLRSMRDRIRKKFR